MEARRTEKVHARPPRRHSASDSPRKRDSPACHTQRVSGPNTAPLGQLTNVKTTRCVVKAPTSRKIGRALAQPLDQGFVQPPADLVPRQQGRAEDRRQ